MPFQTSSLRRFALGTTAACAIAASCVLGAGVAEAAPSVSLITAPINDAARVVIPGNVRPDVKAGKDLGRVPDDTMFPSVYLLLKRSPERTAELNAYGASQYDKSSPNYHKWIRVAELEANYGPNQHDVAVITTWLQGHGITVKAYKPSLIIEIDATAGQLRNAFGVEIHKVLVHGETHIANVNNPSVPAALAGALVGPVKLNDFRAHTMMRKIEKRSHPDPITHEYTLSGGYELVAPADLQTIYNLNPVYSEGYTGQGQTVGLIEDTNLYTLGDWYAFRKVFGLTKPYPYATLTQINPGCAGTGTNSADGEAALDVEWASAAAPNAAIKMYSCNDTSLFGGFVAMMNMYSENNYPSIISISYGEGEAADGASLNATINTLYQEYALAGVSLFVSAGDALAVQDDRGAQIATHGISVSGWAGTAYNVSVGGTDFADTYQGTVSHYWANTNTPNFASALSYIPEIPWNDTCADPLYYQTYDANQPVTEATWTGRISGTTMTVTGSSGVVYIGLTVKGLGVTAGTTITNDLSGTAGGNGTYSVSKSQTVSSEAMSGTNTLSADNAVAACSNTYFFDVGYDSPGGGAGGQSNCFTGTTTKRGVATGTCAGNPKPAFQSVYGNPADGVRDQPDVSLFAANGLWGHYYPFCYSDPTSGYGGASCTDNPSTWSGAGGTSFASPILAGMMALVQQKNGPQGNPNMVLYKIGNQEYGSSGNPSCSSEAAGGPAASCVFNDVQLGDISSPCEKNGTTAYNCYVTSGNTVGITSQSNTALTPSATVGAFGTTPGWDFSTGLGTVNAYSLVNNPNW
jgi:subtilase family serine protease